MLKTFLRPLFLDVLASIITLAVVSAYTYNFFANSYVGFLASKMQITKVFVPGDLRPDDTLIQIGSTRAQDYLKDLHQPLIENDRPGAIIPMIIRRGNQTLEVSWRLPGFNTSELWYRLASQWWLAILFWVAGMIALLGLRPRNTASRVLMSFDFVTAIWLSASSLAWMHIWETAVVLRVAGWLSVPIYLHLHWILPHPPARLPKWFWPLLYLLAALLAVAEWFQRLPASLYTFGLLLALAGSLLLLAAHYIFRPAHRADLRVLLGLTVLALAPLIVVLLLVSAFHLVVASLLLTLLFLPVLPFAYLYTAARRQLGGLELRANRLIALYFFLVTLALGVMFFITLAEAYLPPFEGRNLLLAVTAAALAAIAAVWGFQPFQRFIERRLLGMPLPPESLHGLYAARITASLDQARLTQVLKDEVLPSLLVRQSALLRLTGPEAETVLAQGLDSASALPQGGDWPALMALAGRYRPPAEEDAAQPFPWVRLVLRLLWNQQVIGLWLLGRRDPDDFYSQADIELLRTLADQTTVALVNITQTETLHRLYQANVEQAEAQRTHLARELHDAILNDLASFKASLDERAAPPDDFARVDGLIARLRQIVLGLRPATLAYGLRVAFTALADELAAQAPEGTTIEVDLSPEEVATYAPSLEQHLYRIVQQACENALRHAQPQTVKISGRLAPNEIDLAVEDNGAGFAAPDSLDLSKLVAQKHFGLAGMFERAAIIGAKLQLDSTPGRGTRVHVQWHTTLEWTASSRAEPLS